MLGLLKQRGEEGQVVRGYDQAAGEESSATGNDTITSVLLVLLGVGREDIVFLLTSELEWPADILEDGTFDLFCFRLDNRGLLVNLGQEAVTNLVDLGNVWLSIRSRGL